jgi:transposase
MNSSDQKTLCDSSKSPIKLLSIGNNEDFLPLSELKEDKDVIEELTSSLESLLIQQQKSLVQSVQQITQPNESKSPIVASRRLLKGKIWKDKLNSSELHTLTTSLSQTLDRVSTLNEKDLTPFWTKQSEEISKKLWLPTEIDSVVSVLTSSRESSNSTQKDKSWFSIKEKRPQKKSSLMTSFQLSQYSLPACTDSEATNLKPKSKKKPVLKTEQENNSNKKQTKHYKCIKIRLFPNQSQEEELKLMIDQQRWYYNAIVNIMNNHMNKEALYLDKKKETNHNDYLQDKWYASTIRSILEEYSYKEEIHIIDGKEQVVKQFIKKENDDEKSFPIPYSIQTGEHWWKSVHNRIPRGAVAKYTSSLNSGITNLREKNISKHQMKYQSRKKLNEYLHFDDDCFPKMITKIYSKYWYRMPRSQTMRKYEKTGTRKMRAWISFSEIIKQTKLNGLEIVYDKVEKKYFIHYPVDEMWYPTCDFRNENQVAYQVQKDTIVSLDPGVRKFLVGYDPRGKSIFFGEDVQEQMIQNLLDIDESHKDKKEQNHLKWKRVKNLISEMHWKSINYLIKNYETIMYPDYRVSQMLKKGKLGKMTKRLMTMYRSFDFKQRLEYQVKKYNRKLIIVDESFTSKTCGQCGTLHNGLNGNKVFECPSCGICMDRDASGSRNILLKNLCLVNSVEDKEKDNLVVKKVRKTRAKKEENDISSKDKVVKEKRQKKAKSSERETDKSV